MKRKKLTTKNDDVEFMKIAVSSYLKVKNHMQWSDKKVRLWFATSNPLFGEMAPEEMLRWRPAKFEKILNSLIDGDTP